MLIESTKIHEALNQIAIKCHNHEICSTVECIKSIRIALNIIEASTMQIEFIMDKDKHANRQS